MPEWLKATDNIALVLLAIACARLWVSLESARKEAKQALLDGIEMERDRTAELTSMSAVVSSMQRAIKSLQEVSVSEFAAIRKENRAIYKAIKPS